MKTIQVKDGSKIAYKDFGKGQTIIFSHGWPLSSDAWDAQMLFFGQQGFRVIAHDRRSHGNSSQTWEGNDMDTYAEDLSSLIEQLDLNDVVLVGHSTGGGEVARYIGTYGSARVSKAVLIGAVPPVMLQSENNPGGLPMEVFDGIRAAVEKDRSQFYKDLTTPFFNYNRSSETPSDGVRESFWLQGMKGGIKGQYDCIKQFSEVDFTDDLKKIDVPTLIMHGDDDQIVPLADSAILSAQLVKDAQLKVYAGFGHGMTITQAGTINEGLLRFIEE